MSNSYDISTQQYNRYMTQQDQSPTRKTAVKALMTSPENPFGQAEEDNEDGFQLATHN